MKKKLDKIDEFMKTPDFEKILNDSWNKYKGKLSKEKWEQKYKTLYKNREIGKLTEEKFKQLTNGEPLSLNAGSLGIRNIGNFINGTAREIKSGFLKADSFTKKQIQKDIYLLLNSTSKIKRVEWHLLGGADNGYKRILSEVSPDGKIIYKELDKNGKILNIINL